MNPIRKPTRAGETRKYEFGVIGTRFLVKNLSGGDVTVTFHPPNEGNQENTDSWLLPDGAWQVIPAAENRICRQEVYVTAQATSAASRGVEVEAVEYQLPSRR